MTGQMAAKTIRSVLGWTQADLARETFISERTIRRIERGECTPLPKYHQSLLRLIIQRLPSVHSAHIPQRRIDPERMRHYLHNGAQGWQHWSRTRRGQFRRWRLWYRRVLSDAAMGRCVIVYYYRNRVDTPQARLARALDAAPHWDT